MEGEGKIAVGSGLFKGAFSFATRMGDKPGTNPEELLGASLAGCYAMALNAALEKGATPARNVKAEARVFLGKDDSGFKINRIDLETTADVDEHNRTSLRRLRKRSKKSCPISQSTLAATNITLKATLARSSAG